MPTSIHGTVINRVHVNKGAWLATVQVFDSGRAYEVVTNAGIVVHKAWFKASNLGDHCANTIEGLREYARCLLGHDPAWVWRKKTDV